VEEQRNHVGERDGGLFIAGSRVSLASLISELREGASPETIRQNFPSLFLPQVYGAIAFFLNHPEQAEAYLRVLNGKRRNLNQLRGQPAQTCSSGSTTPAGLPGASFVCLGPSRLAGRVTRKGL
jgi:uncharacterized protein (DUF433 family)